MYIQPMVAEHMVAEGARTSAAIVFTLFASNLSTWSNYVGLINRLLWSGSLLILALEALTALMRYSTELRSKWSGVKTTKYPYIGIWF